MLLGGYYNPAKTKGSSTLNPQPETPAPKPSILHHKPLLLNPESVARKQKTYI